MRKWIFLALVLMLVIPAALLVYLSQETRQLSGIVRDAATQQPLEDVLLRIGGDLTATNAPGEYTLPLPRGKFWLAAEADRYAPAQVEVDATNLLSRTLTLDLTLSLNRVSGVVRDAETSVPLPNAQVVLGDKTAVSNAQGFFEARGVSNNAPIAANVLGYLPVTTTFTGQTELDLALAKEVAAMGFDEIQFDYVRFPGKVGNVYYSVPYTEDSRIAAIAGFLARAQKELRPTGVFISADVFGLTTATEDDQHTGQRLRDLGPYLDYVSPMVYPDTWVNAQDLLLNGLGIPNCTEAVRCPYEVIFNSYKRAAEKTTTKVRPWLQAYMGRGDFGVEQYRIQKKAATDVGSAGWMFWNGTGNYDPKLFEPRK
ncbi:hypothetical protein ANRL1_04889 [Anaerolineae bacterium]|nr:hypothetical protein ANRL1_04889 [Anaerolineae bacterium]